MSNNFWKYAILLALGLFSLPLCAGVTNRPRVMLFGEAGIISSY